MEIKDIHKSYHINSFEVGDIITRVERAPKRSKRYNENLMVEIEVTDHEDGSYMGDKLEYLGIFNRMICFKHRFCGEDRLLKLHYDQWQDGWQKYCIPEL